MSLYRCAACGSNKVVTDKKNEGYSITKGVVGTALFGTGGAIMGANGKSNVYYHCAECGQTLSYSMPKSEKEVIDNAIANPEAFTLFLKSQKKIYPNIEWNEIHDKDLIKKEWCQYTVEEKSAIIWKFYQTNKIAYIEEQELMNLLGYPNEFVGIQTSESLRKKGLITLSANNDKLYYTFYDNPDDIKNNIDEYERKNKFNEQINENWKKSREKIINATIELLRKESENNKIAKELFYKKIKILLENEIDENNCNFVGEYDELIEKLCEKLYHLLIDQNYIIPLEDKVGYLQIMLDDKEREIYSAKKQRIRFEKTHGIYISEIKRILEENEKMTISEMQEKSNLLDQKSQQILSVILTKCEEFEKIIEEKKTYYAMLGTKKKLEEKKKKEQEEIEKYNKEIEEINANINNKIVKLYNEIENENKIIEINKYKFFGSGAKSKNEAKSRIIKLEEEIQNLRSQLKERK